MSALTQQQMDELWKSAKVSIADTCSVYNSLAKNDCIAAIRRPTDKEAHERAQRSLAMSDALNQAELQFLDILCKVWSKLVMVNDKLKKYQEEPQPAKD